MQKPSLRMFAVLLTAFFIFSGIVYSQTTTGSRELYGAPKNADKPTFDRPEGKFSYNFRAVTSPEDNIYSTTTFTFADIVVFSYFDSTDIYVYDSDGNLMDEQRLDKDEYHIFSPGEGVYRVEGSSSYSLLIGDPISKSVMGFFAVNENGSPLSTRLNTYMPKNDWDGEHFIIFAYEDNTEYTLKNLETGDLISAGQLNKGEHYVLDQNDLFLNLTSNKPMSALSYTDQGYYIPASNGTFTGTEFYGFSGYVGSWTNGIIVTAYEDETIFTITDTETDSILMTDTLDEGSVYAHEVSEDTYFSVNSDKPVTVSNTPYAGFSSNYYSLTRHIDRDGLGIGTEFYIATMGGRFDVFSYSDDNDVTITDMNSESEVWTGTLANGEGYNFSNSHSVYKVESTENVSVITSWGGGYGADFMPLNYATSLPDLAISSADISFEPETVTAGDPVEITAMIRNPSAVDVGETMVKFYDGHPEEGGIQIGEPVMTDPVYAGSSVEVSARWVAPENPEIHYVYASIDPEGSLVESNESNNISAKPVVPNEDLMPPLSVTVESPYAPEFTDGTYSPNPFTVKATVFNNGEGEADNVQVTLNELPPGLSLYTSGPAKRNPMDNLPPGESMEFTWQIEITGEHSGILSYSIDVGADNAEVKNVIRGINVKDATPPAAPEGIQVVSTGEGEMTLSWDENGEEDIFGYMLYYDTDVSGEPYEGMMAAEGESPIDVANNTEFTLTGFDPEQTVYVALKAYDTTPNESDMGDELVVTLTDVDENDNVSSVPEDYYMAQNHPNPFNNQTIIEFGLREAQNVSIDLYSIVGEKVATLVNDNLSAGRHKVSINSAELSSGVYLYRIKAGNFTNTKKMVLLK